MVGPGGDLASLRHWKRNKLIVWWLDLLEKNLGEVFAERWQVCSVIGVRNTN